MWFRRSAVEWILVRVWKEREIREQKAGALPDREDSDRETWSFRPSFVPWQKTQLRIISQSVPLFKTKRESRMKNPRTYGCGNIAGWLYTSNITDPELYPGIYVAVKTLLTYPVSTCVAERSFSSMKRLKTPLRNTMSEDRLSSLSVLHIHKHKELDVNEVISEFARRKNRRLALCLWTY